MPETALAVPDTQQSLPLAVVAEPPSPQQLAVVTSMFDPGNVAAFETGQRMARALATATFLPQMFNNNVANCMLLLELRNTMRLPIIEIANGLQLIHGRIGWASSFMMARIKSCREFRNVRYEWRGDEGRDTHACRLVAADREGNTLPGAWISVAMARQEGWWGRTGSKWPTMTEQMLQYRAVSFWTRANAGHLFSGIPDVELVADSEGPRGNGAALDITPRGNGAVHAEPGAEVQGEVQPDGGSVGAVNQRVRRARRTRAEIEAAAAGVAAGAAAEPEQQPAAGAAEPESPEQQQPERPALDEERTFFECLCEPPRRPLQRSRPASAVLLGRRPLRAA